MEENEIKLIKGYLNFILDNLPVINEVQLQKIHDRSRWTIKAGLCGNIPIECNIISKATRSADFVVKFHTYEKEFKFYVNRFEYPEMIIHKFIRKVTKLVNDTLFENEELELIESYHKEAEKKFAEIFKDFKLEDINKKINNEFKTK